MVVKAFRAVYGNTRRAGWSAAVTLYKSSIRRPVRPVRQQCTKLTFDLRFLQGMQADETARRFEDLVSAGESTSSVELTSSLGRRGRGGIAEM